MSNSEYIFKKEPIGFPSSLHILVVSNKERSQLLLNFYQNTVVYQKVTLSHELKKYIYFKNNIF